MRYKFCAPSCLFKVSGTRYLYTELPLAQGGGQRVSEGIYQFQREFPSFRRSFPISEGVSQFQRTLNNILSSRRPNFPQIQMSVV